MDNKSAAAKKPAEAPKKPEQDIKVEEAPKPRVTPDDIVIVEPKNKPPEIVEPPKEPMDPKLKRSIFVLLIGLFTLGVGAFFLFKVLTKPPTVQDAEYLVKIGAWAREDEPTVIWNFTEIGKGSLTTNRHYNDYDFIWAIDGKKLNIETDWLYTLNDTFEFEVNQKKKTLTLTSGVQEITFVPATTVETEEKTEE
ncbi:hypothetical protein IJS18_00595 [Candidatus Saccharibacteria bacterium]|nr:hypothetical protein [Candidatus Saccharibacteria bacterium]